MRAAKLLTRRVPVPMFLAVTVPLMAILTGGTIVFRKHVLRMGARPDAWTPRAEMQR